MPQQVLEPPDPGASHTFIVRLRREPGSVAWRAHVIDVRSGKTTALGIVAGANDDSTPFVSALAAAIERLFRPEPTKEP